MTSKVDITIIGPLLSNQIIIINHGELMLKRSHIARFTIFDNFDLKGFYTLY